MKSGMQKSVHGASMQDSACSFLCMFDFIVNTIYTIIIILLHSRGDHMHFSALKSFKKSVTEFKKTIGLIFF